MEVNKLGRRCKVCKYFSKGHGQYRTEEKRIFEHKIREGISLRELSRYLEYSVRLKVSHNSIRNHIKNCMPEDVQHQREANIEVQKRNSSLKSKVKKLFFRNEDEFVECKHLSTLSWFQDGLVWTRCRQCKKILGKQEPQEKSRNSKEKTLILLEALLREK